MECEELCRLEMRFVEARRRSWQSSGGEDRPADEIDDHSRAELKALLAVLDHRAEHGCQSPAGTTTKLPATRNIGGIIGPY